MAKYTSDDNRSMQLNPNNDRYYSSRGIDKDDLFDHDDHEQSPITCIKGNIMLLEFNNRIINTQKITEITSKLVDLKLKTRVIKGDKYWGGEDRTMVIAYPTVRITIDTDIDQNRTLPGLSLSMDFTPIEPEEERWETTEREYFRKLQFSDYLLEYPRWNNQYCAACFEITLTDEEAIEEEVRKDISKSLNVYARHILKSMIETQKWQLGEE